MKKERREKAVLVVQEVGQVGETLRACFRPVSSPARGGVGLDC